MNDKLKTKLPWLNFRYYPGIHHNRLRKTKKTCPDNQTPDLKKINAPCKIWNLNINVSWCSVPPRSFKMSPPFYGLSNQKPKKKKYSVYCYIQFFKFKFLILSFISLKPTDINKKKTTEQIIHSWTTNPKLLFVLISNKVSLLWHRWAWQLSWNVPEDAGIYAIKLPSSEINK